MKNRLKTFFALSFIALFISFFGSQLWADKEISAHNYLQAGVIDLIKLLPPPPAQNSKEMTNEIMEILKWQDNRPGTISNYAQLDQYIGVFRFADVISDNFTKSNLPFTAAFFKNVQDNLKVVVDPAKNYWNRPRPYAYDSRIKPCVSMPPNASYPSGHSTAGNVFAIILANMIPEKSAAIFDRGWKFAMNRIIGGVHYRSDAMAGRIAATLIAHELFKNDEFLKDYEKSRAEIRKMLKI